MAARLRQLPVALQATLEAQYATTGEICGTGVSYSLACAQPLARETFREYRIRRTRQANKKKRDDTTTPMLWLQKLMDDTEKDPESMQARILGTIVGQARTALSAACEVYSGTR